MHDDNDVIERPPEGAGGGEGVMTEKKISPKAPEKADEKATKSAAARVSKMRTARKKAIVSFQKSAR